MLLGRFSCFGRDDRFVKAALTTIGYVAMNDSTLRCLIQSGREGVKFDFRSCCVPTGNDGTKLFLSRFDCGDNASISYMTFVTLTGAFFC